MPLIVHERLSMDAEIGLWSVEEEEAWFLERLDLSPDEERQLQEIRGERRLEWLGARKLVHRLSGRPTRSCLVKDEHGKPAIKGSTGHLSISHSRRMAAAIIAPRPVGIDIQHRTEKLERIAVRFLHPGELAALDTQRKLDHLHVLWGTKEALYKAYGRRQLDFASHIRVPAFAFEPAEGAFRAFIEKADYRAGFQVQYRWLGDYCLVFAISD